VWLGDDKVLTLVGDSSRYPKVGMVDANHGLYVVDYGLESNNLFNEDGNHLVIFDEEQEICGAQYVIDGRPHGGEVHLG
jgi:hypothetical protein